MFRLLLVASLVIAATAQATQGICGPTYLPAAVTNIFGNVNSLTGISTGNAQFSICPITAAAQATTSMGTQFQTCIQAPSALSCVWDAYNSKLNAGQTMMTDIFVYGDQARMANQWNCELYAIFQDCIKSSSSCSPATSQCLQEFCAPSAAQLATDTSGTSVTSGGGTFKDSPCYDTTLSTNDPGNFAGCVAASGSFVSSLPSVTWRSLRDSLQAQQCLCKDTGRVDTDWYWTWSDSVAAPQPACNTAAKRTATIPYCKYTNLAAVTVGLLPGVFTASVLENYITDICTASERLVTCSSDIGLTSTSGFDTDTQETCYAGRDDANSAGLAVGSTCFAKCDINGAASFAAAVLLALL